MNTNGDHDFKRGRINIVEDKELQDAAIAYWRTQVGRDTARPAKLAFCGRDFKAGWKECMKYHNL